MFHFSVTLYKTALALCLLALLSMVGCNLPAAGQTTTPGGAQITFLADRYTLQAGECTMLHWSAQGGQSVEINGQPVANSGEMQVCPATTTIYTDRKSVV